MALNRSKNITREQKELLVTLLEEDIALANDRFDSPNGKMEIREGWQRISLQLNSLGGATKEADKWKKAWIDMKKYVRAQWAILKEYDNRTGLGTHVTTRRPNQLSHLDERILSVITTEAVEGTSTSEGGAFLSASRETENIEPIVPVAVAQNADVENVASERIRPVRSRRIRGSAFTRDKILEEANNIDREKADALKRLAGAKEKSNELLERRNVMIERMVSAMEERNRFLREYQFNQRYIRMDRYMQLMQY